ncbi:MULTISPECIES: hypothetical protein [spotted fever group]|uniref:Uncharacterized protein n=2 Tax=spotted fever group TaxID=114277 RepID=A0A0F3PFP9_RICRH|nr:MULTISPECIES: hypothetical protein [spotted fever group]AFB31834.1 hypothetical protein RMB_05365 [Rickettsia massiliae str. AZT80]KJV79190.1 hypothetical protein RMAECT_1184 [Rickettsia rhipicephali str. Ect]
MSKLIEYLEKIQAEEILKELEKDPATLSITEVNFVPQSPVFAVAGYSKIPEDALNGLFNALQGDATIKYLSTDSFSWSLKSIKFFAEFFKDPLYRITDISVINALNNVNKIAVLLDTLRVNGTIENIKLAHNYLRDKVDIIYLKNL